MLLEEVRQASNDIHVLLVTMLCLVAAAALTHFNTRRSQHDTRISQAEEQGLTQQNHRMELSGNMNGIIAIAEFWQMDVAVLESILARRKWYINNELAIDLPRQAEGWRLTHTKYTQKSIVDHVDPSHGQSGQQSFADFLDRLIWCELPADEIPPMRICYYDGVYWSLDNHRLYAFHLLLDLVGNIKNQIQASTPGNPKWRYMDLQIEIDLHGIVSRCTKQLLLFRSVLVNLGDPGIAQEFRNKRQGNGNVPDVRESGRFPAFPNIYMLPGAYLWRQDGTRERCGAVAASWFMYGGYGYRNLYFFGRKPAPL